jgi:hypothetical protein
VGGFALLFVNVNKKMAAKAAERASASIEKGDPAKRGTHAEAKPSGKKKSSAEPAAQAPPPKRVKPIVPVLAVIAIFLVSFA